MKKSTNKDGPVFMSQDEMDRVKSGNKEIVKRIHEKIVAISPVSTKRAKATKKLKKSAPVKITDVDLMQIQKTGKLPSALEKKINATGKKEISASKSKTSIKESPSILPEKKR